MGGREFLKRILTHLYCTKYNEINVCHLNIQKACVKYAETARQKIKLDNKIFVIVVKSKCVK